MLNLNKTHQPHLLSPTAFILDLDHPIPPQLDLNQQELDVQQDHNQKYSPDEAARTNSREEKKRLAGVRSREKKKKYVEDLEEKVKMLSAEVEKYDSEISKCKNNLVEAIQAANSVSFALCSRPTNMHTPIANLKDRHIAKIQT